VSWLSRRATQTAMDHSGWRAMAGGMAARSCWESGSFVLGELSAVPGFTCAGHFGELSWAGDVDDADAGVVEGEREVVCPQAFPEKVAVPAAGRIPALFNKRRRHAEPMCHRGSVREAVCQLSTSRTTVN
jgi:hypothetical protein